MSMAKVWVLMVTLLVRWTKASEYKVDSMTSASSSSVLHVRHAHTVLCPLSEYIDDSEQVVREFFECPMPSDPSDHTRCCGESCCRLVAVDGVLQLELRTAMHISLAVITGCLLAGILVVVCCFCPACPAYDACTGSWSTEERKRSRQRLQSHALIPGYVNAAQFVNGNVAFVVNNNHDDYDYNNYEHHKLGQPV